MVLVQGRAQVNHRLREIVVGSDPVRPTDRDQPILRHDLAGVRREFVKQREVAIGERKRDAVAQQTSRPLVEQEWPEREPAVGRHRGNSTREGPYERTAFQSLPWPNDSIEKCER